MSKILDNTLPAEVIDLFNKELTTAIISTVTEDGFPHAMPVHLMFAPDHSTIRLALMCVHKTVANIKNNSKAFITILEGPDIALGIKGSAKVIREPMNNSSAMCMVEFKVEEIKSDTTPTVIVVEGIRNVHRTEKTKPFFRGMFDELYKG